MVMLGRDKALSPDFASKLPAKEKDVFDLTTKQGEVGKRRKEEQKSNDAICALISESGSTKQAQLRSES
jgi:hypothetical protein